MFLFNEAASCCQCILVLRDCLFCKALSTSIKNSVITNYKKLPIGPDQYAHWSSEKIALKFKV